MDVKENKELIMGNMVRAVEMLQNCPEFSCLMPEVRVNLAYALPEAKTSEDVAAIDGRITVVQGLPHAAGITRWGASDHMARLIMEIRKYEPSINAGINFKCDAAIIDVVKKYCSEQNILFGKIDRTEEPAEITEQDGASMPWKIKQLVTSSGGAPGLFYEGDGWGKEPLFVAIGSNAVEVTAVAIDIAHRYCKR